MKARKLSDSETVDVKQILENSAGWLQMKEHYEEEGVLTH